jgi:hypothetical protein
MQFEFTYAYWHESTDTKCESLKRHYVLHTFIVSQTSDLPCQIFQETRQKGSYVWKEEVHVY